MDTEQPPKPNGAESTTLYKILHWDKFFESEAPPRLGMEVGHRLPLTTTSAFSAGLAIGATHGSKKAAYRFRAENAHRFPTTPTGWFQYHKTKNYISIVGGVKEGVKMGFKLGTGALAFCLFEETVDYARHDQRDFISTVTAGLSFSGIYSLLGKLLVWLEFTHPGEMKLISILYSSARCIYCGANNQTWSEAKSGVWTDAGRA